MWQIRGEFQLTVSLTLSSDNKASKLNTTVAAALNRMPEAKRPGAISAPIARPNESPATLKAIKVARPPGMISVIMGMLLTSMNSNVKK